MKTTVVTTETYKGVELTGIRTKEMIDTIIEKRDEMTAKDIAQLVGFENFHPIIGIYRGLNKHFGIESKYATNKKEFKPIKTANNTFKNYYGTGKDKARDLIAESVMRTKRRSSNVLTLPADTWLMEKNILKQKSGYRFTAVERDKDTYKRMVKNLTKDDNLFDAVISTTNKSVSEVIVNDVEDQYSCAILDYCGYIDSFYNEINDIMQRNLIKTGGYIAITLAENDRMLNNPLQMTNKSNTYIDTCYVDEDVDGGKVTNDLINFLTFSNKGYKITTKFKYRDSRANMLLFIIQRID